KKKGAVLYTNVLYYESLKSAGNILSKLKVKNNLFGKAATVKEKINKNFWDEERGYYFDYIKGNKKSKVFSSDGNYFSIMFELVYIKKATSILKKENEYEITKDLPSMPNFPKYKGFEVYLPLYIMGLSDYNNYGVCWPWIGALHSIALAKIGKVNESKRILN